MVVSWRAKRLLALAQTLRNKDACAYVSGLILLLEHGLVRTFRFLVLAVLLYDSRGGLEDIISFNWFQGGGRCRRLTLLDSGLGGPWLVRLSRENNLGLSIRSIRLVNSFGFGSSRSLECLLHSFLVLWSESLLDLLVQVLILYATSERLVVGLRVFEARDWLGLLIKGWLILPHARIAQLLPLLCSFSLAKLLSFL